MSRLVTPMPDSVSEALRSVSVRSTLYCVSELRAPWAFRIEGERVAKFHVVVEGSALLVRPSEAPLALRAGDVVVLPRGATHTLADGDASAAIPLGEILAAHPLEPGLLLRYGGNGARTRLICGGFALAEGVPEETLAVLPEVIVLERDRAGGTAWLEPVLAALNSEAEDGLPGTNAILARFADVFLAQVFRAWMIDAKNGDRGEPALITDRSIANAVFALNSRLSETWSLDRLARHVGLSRSALAVKFREAVGASPMRYLTRVRLDRAAAYLSSGRLTIHEIARLTGFENEATLSKAFKRQFGIAPGAYRRTANRSPEIEIVSIKPFG
jgi:AraC-like DNA-binding protein